MVVLVRFVLNICRLVGQAFYLVVKGNEANALAMTPHFPRLVKASPSPHTTPQQRCPPFFILFF